MTQTTTPDEMNRLLQQQQQAFLDDGYASLKTRQNRLQKCIDMLVDNADAFCDAVNSDFGCRSRHVTRMNDLFTSINTLKYVKKNLKQWMRPERRKAMFPMGWLGARAEVQFHPKGVVGIMSPWNVPINLIFGPLADALAAGNRVLLKPSEVTSNTAELITKLINQHFAETEIAVINGGADVAQAFSALPLDHLIYTGSTHIGKAVMRAAADNLTPVTLELGGKSPVIISPSANLEDTVSKLISFKTMNAGQVCLSPDYSFLPEQNLEQFIELAQSTFNTLYPQVLGNEDYVSVIHANHFRRTCELIDDAIAHGCQVVQLGGGDDAWRNHSEHKIPVHLIINPPENARVMQEELFCPILCVNTYTDINRCIDEINCRPQALALYYFGKNKQQQNDIIQRTRSGGVCINDLAVHFACDDLPFGGVGDSGMGHYHGQDGFKTLSHQRAVYAQGWVNLQKLSGTLPPYGDKVEKVMSSMIKK